MRYRGELTMDFLLFTPLLEGDAFNWVLLSLIRIPGVPKRVTMVFYMNFIIFLPMMVVVGPTSIHLLK